MVGGIWDRAGTGNFEETHNNIEVEAGIDIDMGSGFDPGAGNIDNVCPLVETVVDSLRIDMNNRTLFLFLSRKILERHILDIF